MLVKRVEEEDAAELLKIYAPYVENTAITFEYSIPSMEQFKNRIRQISARYPYIKAVEKGEILGYAYANTFKDREAYDWSVETTVYVDQNKKRQGIGRFLYQQLEKSLIDMGILNMNACIACPMVEDEYLTNDSYYCHKNMGFELAGRFHRSGYKFGKWYDMIWMEKMIGEHPDQPGKVLHEKWHI